MYYVLCPECSYIGFAGSEYSPLKASGKNKGAKLEILMLAGVEEANQED